MEEPRAVGGQRRRLRVPVRERALRVEDLIVIDGHRTRREVLAERLQAGGYRLWQTAHFLLAERDQEPRRLLVHFFAPRELDADLGACFLNELRPAGWLAGPDDLGRLFAGVIGSSDPHDPARAWRRYGENTLQRYRSLLQADHAAHSQTSPCPDSPITIFASLYRRVRLLLQQEPAGATGRLLDAGCSFGFLPLLLAEACPGLKEIVGLDLRPDAFLIAQQLAAERGWRQIRFVQADLCRAEQIIALGQFDTVVALHVLEHFDPEEGEQVLSHLLMVARRRLIIAVPYEEQPEPVYGHRQTFSPTALDELGRRCLKRWGQYQGRYWCEECAGGLLVIERDHDGV
ncbi:class I SAM-dependent methyltransferase [Thermogemmatispora sp.]|uniref:class I SAM-dependent methyltransferase n=1 Tax=Thermogemmatispora sp. TaxID=1968838 RepID=UPI001D615A37|nr:class I SAM-dependent methyltransferase [Thermogemmatispora sp.]MBX5448971.1 class I SAM-dependent methyltransferase [Thermogemmatispora sp.]